MSRKFLLIAIAFTFGFAFSLWIQNVEAQFTIGSSANVTVSPELPRPGELVTMEATSLRSNIDKAFFTWSVNGKVIEKGIGKKIFQFQNSKSGITKVSVAITMEDGEEIEKNYNFSGAAVDLVWKANTYVPPFYKGRALPSYQSDVTVIALPTLYETNGSYLSPDKLLYKWEKDGYVIDSGYGKSSIIVEGQMIERPSAITVLVTSFNGQIQARGELTITKQSPEIIFYENNPLYGTLFNHALEKNATINSREIGLTAYPYFFSAFTSTDPSFSYSWTMNGSPLVTDSPTPTVTFKTPGTTGQSNIGLRVTNTLRELQFSDKSLIVNYNQNNTGPSF
jgi:hypothetical protein